jgi:hypothetical protein
MNQTRKRCPVGYHKDRQTKECRPLDPCYPHPEAAIIRNFITALDKLDTNEDIPLGLTQTVPGGLPAKLLPVTHLKRHKIGDGAENMA